MPADEEEPGGADGSPRLFWLAVAARVFVHSPEDILLQRLAWYRADGEVSDRQWPDTRAIVLRQADRLGLAYVRDTAAANAAPIVLARPLRASRPKDPN